MTNWTAANNILQQSSFLNEITNGMGWTLILAGWTIVVFTALAGQDPKKALLVSSVSSAALALLFFTAGLITSWVLGIFVVLMGLLLLASFVF